MTGSEWNTSHGNSKNSIILTKILTEDQHLPMLGEKLIKVRSEDECLENNKLSFIPKVRKRKVAMHGNWIICFPYQESA
jgi:hypothetical protein